MRHLLLSMLLAPGAGLLWADEIIISYWSLDSDRGTVQEWVIDSGKIEANTGTWPLFEQGIDANLFEKAKSGIDDENFAQYTVKEEKSPFADIHGEVNAGRVHDWNLEKIVISEIDSGSTRENVEVGWKVVRSTAALITFVFHGEDIHRKYEGKVFMLADGTLARRQVRPPSEIELQRFRVLKR